MIKKTTTKQKVKKTLNDLKKPISKAGLTYREMQKNPMGVILDMRAVLK